MMISHYVYEVYNLVDKSSKFFNSHTSASRYLDAFDKKDSDRYTIITFIVYKYE